MADRRDLRSTVALILLLIIAEGDGCGIPEVEKQIISYLGCVKGQEFVNLEKKVDNLEEACRKDIDLFQNCELNHFTRPLGPCITEIEANVTTMTSRMFLTQNRFLCDGEFSVIREFWDNDGLNCKNESSTIFQRNKCFNFAPLFFDDYSKPETCNKLLKYLQCIGDSIPSTCSFFARRVIYTYFKRSVLPTPCKETLIKDKTDLEILVTIPPPTQKEDSNSSRSIVSNAYILSLILFLTASIISF